MSLLRCKTLAPPTGRRQGRSSGRALHLDPDRRAALQWQLPKKANPASVHGSGVSPHLDAWLAWACRCRIPAIVKLSHTIRAHREGIIAAVELGLSNSKLEGLNSKIRLINHRGYGHHTAAALIAMLYLCASGISIQLPTES